MEKPLPMQRVGGYSPNSDTASITEKNPVTLLYIKHLNEKNWVGMLRNAVTPPVASRKEIRPQSPAHSIWGKMIRKPAKMPDQTPKQPLYLPNTGWISAGMAHLWIP